MIIELNEAEHAVLLDMLDRLDDYLSASGCNDYDLPATPENRQLLLDAYRANDPQATDPDDWMPNLEVRRGRYFCSDSVVFGYVRRKIAGGCDAARVPMEWIPIGERLPAAEDGPVVLVAHGRRVPGVVKYDARTGLWRGAFTDCPCEGVTHWCPLPAVPGVKPA